MTPRGVISSLLTLLTVLAAGCGRGTPDIVIGSETTTEQSLVAEIVAQHLESRLGYRVKRSPSIGGPLLAFQDLQGGGINIYPEYTGTIITEILKEQPSPNPDQIFERAKGEMARIALAQLVGPLGINSSYVAVIRASDPHASQLSSLSDAALVTDGWKLGYSFEFQQQPDAMPALTQYHLPMSVPMRPMESAALFKSLQEGQLTMILTHATDGALRSNQWKILSDDRKLFTPEQLCLLVRQDLVKAEPRLSGALAELDGKLTNEKMRALNSQVDLDHQNVTDAARAFLASMK